MELSKIFQKINPLSSLKATHTTKEEFKIRSKDLPSKFLDSLGYDGVFKRAPEFFTGTQLIQQRP